MAIAPTGDIFKGFEFDGESSKDYGVYITGEAVYNAPTRDVEMISIPGRNGAFALDGGRFENIEVTYPAGIFADDETNFAEAISDFRNYLCSRNGYVRLSDEYHPNEYRMAIYKSGLEVSPAQLKAGEFNIVFDCKPQRWLTAGETEITVADGETLANPTLFDASPLLEVKGYGTISFGNYAIELENVSMGNVTIVDSFNFTGSETVINVSSAFLNTGDTISISSMLLEWFLWRNVSSVTSVGFDSTADSATGVTSDFSGLYGRYCYTKFPSISFTNGTSGSYSNMTTINGHYTIGSTSTSFTATITTSVTYNATAGTITISRTANNVPSQVRITYNDDNSVVGDITGDSTKSALGDPTYIDCDIAEAYRIESSGEIVSLNRYIDLGSNLPKLAKGNNLFALDNTITELKIVPRWWKI